MWGDISSLFWFIFPLWSVGVIYTEWNAWILSLISFAKYIGSYNPHPCPYKDIYICITSANSLTPSRSHGLLFLLLSPLINFDCSKTSNTQNYAICAVLCLPSLTQHTVFWDSFLLCVTGICSILLLGSSSSYKCIPQFSYWCSFEFSSLELLRIKLLWTFFIQVICRQTFLFI